MKTCNKTSTEMMQSPLQNCCPYNHYEHRDQDQSGISNRGMHRRHVDGDVC